MASTAYPASASAVYQRINTALSERMATTSGILRRTGPSSSSTSLPSSVAAPTAAPQSSTSPTASPVVTSSSSSGASSHPFEAANRGAGAANSVAGYEARVVESAPRELNVTVSIPADHTLLTAHRSVASSSPPLHGAPNTNPADTSTAFAVVAAVAGSFGEGALRLARSAADRLIVTPIRTDPFVASLGALASAVLRYADDLRINGRVVAEDPMPALRRLFVRAVAAFGAAVQTRRFASVVAVFGVVVALARMGVFYANKSAVSASMVPIVFSPLGPDARTVSVLPVSSPRTPVPIIASAVSLRRRGADEEREEKEAADGTTTPRQGQEGSIATMTSRFLALFTNSPAPAGGRSLRDEATVEVEAPTVVVSNGPYVETYEVRMTSASSPVLEDPDRFVTSLIESHVREERRRSPPQPSEE